MVERYCERHENNQTPSYTLCAILPCVHPSLSCCNFDCLRAAIWLCKAPPVTCQSRLADCSEASSSPTFRRHLSNVAAPLVSGQELTPSSFIRQQARDNNSTVGCSCTCLALSAVWGPDWHGQLLNARQPEMVKFAAERVPHAQPWRLVARCRR